MSDRPPELIENPSEEDYADAARWALERNDIELALQQAAAAVTLRPLHAPHLLLLDSVIARAKMPLRLLQEKREGQFFGTTAARARALARLRRYDDALATLACVVTFRPQLPFLVWARDWVQKAKQRKAIKQQTVTAALIQLTDAARERPLSEGLKHNFEAALDIADALNRDRAPSAALSVATSRVLRALDRAEEAARRLDEQAQQAPAWEVSIERAAVSRQLGNADEALSWLLQARLQKPQEPSTCLDIGDHHLSRGHLDDAIAAYEQALSLDSNSGWAALSAAYARALKSPAPPQPDVQQRDMHAHDVQQLDIAVRLEKPADRAFAGALQADLNAYQSRLCAPTDPLIGVVRGMIERARSSEGDTPIRARARADRPLCPSLRHAIHMAARQLGQPLQLEVRADIARAPAFGPLWSSTGEPAAQAPPDAVQIAVNELARQRFDWPSWCNHAAELAQNFSRDNDHDARLAQSLGIDNDHGARPAQSLEIDNDDSPGLPRDISGDCVSVMTAAPAPPLGDEPLLWLYRIQVAAAVLAALAPCPPDSRLNTLAALLDGRDDWTASAAVIGLRALAERNNDCREPVLRLLAEQLPQPTEPLAVSARAVAIAGCALATGDARAAFLALRVRARAELS